MAASEPGSPSCSAGSLGHTISSGVLGLLVLATLPFRPFTEDYAREQTPPEISHTPEFRRTNQVITLVWGGVFVGTAILGAIAASSPSSSDWTNWILPIALIVVGFKFTARYPEVVRERVRREAARSQRDALSPGRRQVREELCCIQSTPSGRRDRRSPARASWRSASRLDVRVGVRSIRTVYLWRRSPRGFPVWLLNAEAGLAYPPQTESSVRHVAVTLLRFPGVRGSWSNKHT
jgi:hypothetical protein